ncbi:MAG: imidazole glycerol phosphate synthase subunit HisH [Clostridia bacterium]|nr:imidazole glycerol phosphate synthase subunit HisH [Clostridia bacterium]MBR4458566.1 imidazole glycerol phosphate synthase subunit HisH [Clostridia bacterium]
MIAIIDYGMGNLRSVQKAFAYLGSDARITDDAALIRDASHVVLPGVGAFRDAIARLRETGLDEAFLGAAGAGKPCLGICLGMQLVYEWSEENGRWDGLGLFPGGITRLNAPGLKIPHMGWNTIRTRACPIFDAGQELCVYFVHSYCAAEVRDDVTAAVCEYGTPFTAVVSRGNVTATQFHPEKSGSVGLEMLRRFAALK